MGNFQKYLFAALALALTVGAYFFYLIIQNSSSSPVLPPIETQPKINEITIGWIGPLTGPARSLGIDNFNAVNLGLWQYDLKKNKEDPKIHFVYANDEYNPQKTVKEYKKMVMAYNPQIIFVSSYSGLKKIADYALNDNVIIINPIDNDLNLANINKNIFLIGKETESLTVIDAESILAQGLQKTAVFYYSDDDFMPYSAYSLKKILQNAGKKVYLYKYSRGTKDFYKFLEEAKANHVDSYAFFGYFEIGYAMEQARKLGITAPFFSLNLITDPTFQETSGGAVNGTYFAHFTSLDGNREIAAQFLKDYQEKYQETPLVEWTAMQAYDAINIVIDAILQAKKFNGDLTDNLRKALFNVRDFEGTSGNISIGQNGASSGIYPAMYILKNGKSIKMEKNK